MMIKLRHHLIIGCALMLSVGGVFAAWTFGSFEEENVELEANVSSVLPAERWNFDTVYVTFNAGSNGDFGLDSDSNEITSKSLSTFEGRQITYDTFDTLNLNVDDGYLFLGWFDEEDKPFEIDVIRSNDNDQEVYTARYLQLTDSNKSTTWSLYDYNDNILGTFVDNPGDNGSQLILYNIKFEVNEDNKQNEIYYIQNHLDEPTKYDLKSTYNWMNGSEQIYGVGENNVKSGIYYVIFDPVNTYYTDISWAAHGGRTFLNRLYQYSVVGDPSNTWDSSSDSLVTFGYVSTVTDGSGTYKVYRADNVFFDKDLNLEFKLNEANSFPYFDGIPDGYDFDTEYINRVDENDDGSNLILDTSVLGEHDYYMMTFYINVYETAHNTNTNIYNYPHYVYLSIEVKTYTVNYYGESGAGDPIQSIKVMYNASFPECNFEPANKFYTEWADIDTNEVIDTSTGVIKDYYLYPSSYVDAVNVYFYNANNNSGTLYKHYKIEKGTSLSDTFSNPTYSDSNYIFEGWATGSSAGSLVSDALTKTYDTDTTYYAKFSYLNYLQVNSTYHNPTGKDSSNIYFELKTNKDTTVYLCKKIAYANSYERVKTYTITDTVVSSGFYQVYFSLSDYTVTQKRIVQVKIYSEAGNDWTSNSPWIALYAFNNSSNTFDYKYRGNALSFETTYSFYIGMSYTTVIVLNIKNGQSTVGTDWANKTTQTQNIALNSNESSNNNSWKTSYSSTNCRVDVYGNYNLGWCE